MQESPRFSTSASLGRANSEIAALTAVDERSALPRLDPALPITSTYFTGLPLGTYGAGIIDPGWLFNTYSAKGRGKCADQKYRCDPLADIKAMPIGELFKPDAAIALWFTQYAGHWAPEVLAAWGFGPRTLGAWAKQTVHGKWFFGQGKILRSAAEFYMIGVRGKPPVRSHSVRNLIVARVREHSRKPDQLHQDMERLYDGPYCELFARRHTPGWTCWGNQLEPEEGRQAPLPIERPTSENGIYPTQTHSPEVADALAAGDWTAPIRAAARGRRWSPS